MRNERRISNYEYVLVYALQRHGALSLNDLSTVTKIKKYYLTNKETSSGEALARLLERRAILKAYKSLSKKDRSNPIFMLPNQNSKSKFRKSAGTLNFLEACQAIDDGLPIYINHKVLTVGWTQNLRLKTIKDYAGQGRIRLAIIKSTHVKSL